MSIRGVFAVDRAIFQHSAFADEPFTQREAWMWLIGEAAWRARARRIGPHRVELKRGEVAASIRYLADTWTWSKSRVGRFLEFLENETMIGTAAGQGITVITICNYAKFQKVGLPDETQIGTDNGTAAGQQRDKTEALQTLGKQEESLSAEAEQEVPTAEIIQLPAQPYAFEGEIFRVKQVQFDRWRKQHPAIPDLAGELALADAWYVDRPLDDPKKWFFPVSKWLERANREQAFKPKRKGVYGDDYW